MARKRRVRIVMVRDGNTDDGWEVELGPFDRIVSIDHDGNTAWVYIEVGEETP